MADPTYTVEVEFVSGSFTNITSEVLRISIDRSIAGPSTSLQTGIADILLFNETGKFTPEFKGPERISNGGFDSNTIWSKESGWSISGGYAVKTAGDSKAIYQNIACTIGEPCIAQWELSQVNCGAVSLMIGGNPPDVPYSAQSILNTYRTKFVAQSTSYTVGLFANSDFDGKVDNFSVKRAELFHDLLLPGKDINISATQSGTTYPLFYGKISRVTLNPSLGRKTAQISCIDQVETLRRKHLDTVIRIDSNVTSFFTEIFSECGVASFTVNSLGSSIPYAWYQEKAAMNAFNDLIEYGGYSIYNRADGILTVEAPYTKLLSSPVGSYNEFFSFNYDLNDRSIINNCKVSGQARALSTSVNTMAWQNEVLSIPASSGIGFWLTYVDPNNNELGTPANSMVTPVNSTDYTTNTNSAGTGSNVTSTASASVVFYGASAVCSIFNGHSATAFLTKFQLRGYAIQKQPMVSAATQNSASIANYGDKTKVIKNDFIADTNYAQSYANDIVYRFAKPRPQIDATFKNIFPDVVNWDLGDVVHITQSLSNVASNQLIKQLNHTITLTSGLEHVTRVTFDSLRYPKFGYTNKSFSVNSETNNSAGNIAFKPDGTQMYIGKSFASSCAIFQYPLSAPWDIETASYTGSMVNLTQPTGLSGSLIKRDDGTKAWFWAGNNLLYQYSLPTPWDITTLSYDFKSYIEVPSFMQFNNYGTRLVYRNLSTGKMEQATLSIAYDISTMSAAAGSFQTSPYCGLGTTWPGFVVNNDGTKVLCAGRGIVGANGATLVLFELSTAWDISTAVFRGETYSLEDPLMYITDFYHLEGTDFLYILGYDGAKDVVYQYYFNYD